MERYTIKQRIQIIECYIQSSKSVTVTIRKIKGIFGIHHSISKNTVQAIVNKFYRTGSVHDLPRSGRPRTGRSTENIAAVSESVRESPSASVRHRAQELAISKTSVHQILRIDLHLHPYKVQLTQQLNIQDHRQRREFAAWALERLDEDKHFFEKIIFSDEANFYLGGYVNKQNCRIWGSENPNAVEQKPMRPEKVNVWCGLWFGGIIGPYFFENDEGKFVTVNEARYKEMLEYFLWSELEGKDLHDKWFQQDGASSHTTSENIDVLRTRFPGRVISRFGDVSWPPRSCDLTPLDFFLWGHVKDKVYANNPQTIAELKTNIRHAIGVIPLETIKKCAHKRVSTNDLRGKEPRRAFEGNNFP